MKAERSRTALCTAVMALALLAAGCGSDDEGGSGSGASNPKGEGIRAGTGDRTDKAKAAGEAAAKEAGPAKLPANKKIGIINILGGIESADRLEATLKEGLSGQKWTAIPCDGQGDPAKMLSCGNSLLDRNVDAIITIAVDSALIKPVITKANAAKVPIVQVAGQSGDGYDGSWYPNEGEKGGVLADELIKRLNGAPGDKAELAIHDYPAPWAKVRTDVLKEKVKKNPKIDIVADTQTDATQLLDFTKKTVADQLTANPNIKGFWFSFDATGQAGGPVIAQKYPGKKFPERPLIATFHADLGTQALMRKDQIDLVVDSNYDAATWMGVDALYQYFARDTEIPDEPQPEWPGVGQLFFFKIITKENLPPEGEYVETPVDVPAYFQAKWAAEFGGGGS